MTPHKTFLITKALKNWEKCCIGNIKNQLAIAKEAIWLIDQAQERRTLTQAKTNFKARLKDVYLGLLAVQKISAQQRARLTNIRYGDANLKLFYLRANNRKRKKHIPILQTEGGLAIKHEDKAKEIKRHFGEMLSTKRARTSTLNWDELGYRSYNLMELDTEITGEEVQLAMASIPKENASGPDSFIGAFYHKCWDIVKGDVTAAVQQLSQLRGQTFTLLNTVNIVLLPKKEQAGRIGDYRPISLVHSITKIFSKVLANRLAP
jgi:hypothetical protein